MFPWLLPATFLVASTFTDVQERFSITLPKDWQFKPQPGDTSGASFRKVVDELPAHAWVRVVPLSEPLTAEEFLQRLHAPFRQEKGYRVLKSGEADLGKHAAAAVRCVLPVDDQGKWQRMLEQRAIVVAGTGYLVHVETLAEAFAFFEGDFATMFSSFTPKDPHAKARAKAKRLDPRRVLGTWVQREARTVLRLNRDGSFAYGEHRGRFVVQGNDLLLQAEEEPKRRYGIEFVGKAMVLHALETGRPLIFDKTETDVERRAAQP